MSMKLTDWITTLVGSTSLDPTRVKGFLQTPPHYHRWGVAHQLNQFDLDRLQATDLFEFYLRQYVSGRHKTLHAVLREVQTFTSDDPAGACYCLGYSLAYMRQQLLVLEWYELLPRLDTAREQIVLLTPLIEQSVRRTVVSLPGDEDV